MKFGVVIFPGSNCDHDMIYAFRDIMKQEVVPLWHKDHSLQNADGVILPGGFSFGDYLRSGALARFSPIMEEIIDFADDGGFVFGVCNGFQILCESGLLPGTLLHNNNRKFVCKNTYIIPDAKNTHLTHQLDTSPLKIPVAHGEGRYYAPDSVLADMRRNGQILFRYSDENGIVSQETNPNGSVENIAGVCNRNKNVYGMMPHPERAVDKDLGNTDGITIFNSVIKMLK
ncbi:MAG: phosphoribosylformylglycinamidine synthase subunit PurQ [Prevotellaceae bacterium]|jgi:phosphoribosylformylglycinamidine synthase|nr:phosphoribosylformylglycinamidine synthase subunit PurQ [Prevotellaceae bacterium]